MVQQDGPRAVRASRWRNPDAGVCVGSKFDCYSRRVARLPTLRRTEVLSAFVNAFRTPDLRRKLLFVLGIIVLSLVPGIVAWLQERSRSMRSDRQA